MPTPELVRAIMEQATSSGSRSTVLQPLIWLVGFLLTATLLAAKYQLIPWLVYMLAVLLGFSISIFLIAFVVFSMKNPDYLRSEKFTLSKMAIEKNLIGDDIAGLHEVTEYDSSPITTALPNHKEDKQ